MPAQATSRERRREEPGTVPRRGVVVNPEAIEPGLAARVFRSAPIGLAVTTAPGTITWASRGILPI